MSNKTLYNINDFSKGLNLKDSPSIIPLNSLTEAQNAILQKGTVSKRPGYERFVSAPIERIATWQDVGGKKWSEL